MKIYRSKNGQTMPTSTQFFDKEAFNKIDCTKIIWMGNTSMMFNSKGTNIMIVPLLEGFDVPLTN